MRCCRASGTCRLCDVVVPLVPVDNEMLSFSGTCRLCDVVVPLVPIDYVMLSCL